MIYSHVRLIAIAFKSSRYYSNQQINEHYKRTLLQMNIIITRRIINGLYIIIDKIKKFIL
jgi:hypothetical protein